MAEPIILEIHAVSERKFWKENRSGAVGIALAIAYPDEDPMVATGVDPQSDHNSRTWIWAATEAVIRLTPSEGDRLLIRGMHPLIRKAFHGRGALHGKWLSEFGELKREIRSRFGDGWAYRHRKEMKGCPGFHLALKAGRRDSGIREMDWPEGLAGPKRALAENSLFDEVFG